MSSSTAATQDRCDYQLHISQHWGPLGDSLDDFN
jgi:hypothetical protein